MPEVEITEKTMWECIRCGKCCRGIILDKNESLSIKTDSGIKCKFLNEESNMCADYANRPFICQLYPFVIQPETMVDEDGVAKPQKAFMFEHMKIHTECAGYGKGKRIVANKNLEKKFQKMGMDFALKFKDMFDSGEDISKII